MTKEIPRISVTVVTYKQEKLIGRTLDSLLAQKDYLYEICVSDDCSPDNTWKVLLDYQQRYPELIKLHRHEKNIGIFANTDYAWRMPTGDIVNEIAGDDTTPIGWYKKVIEFIIENNIDWKKELFCIYGDFKAEYPNGDYMVFSNKAVAKRPNDALRLALRGIISHRGCCTSINVFRKFDECAQGRSHKVEHVQDRQFQINAEKNYYIPMVANVYYTGIGVSTRVQDEETYKDRLEIWPYTLRYFDSKGINLPKKDYEYAKFIVCLKKYMHHHNLSAALQTFYAYFRSRDYKLPRGNSLKHIVFALRRRMPHNKPIHFD